MTLQQLDYDSQPDTELAPDETLAGPITLPTQLTSPQAKLVYLYLVVRGTVSVDELGTSLGLPKLTLFSILVTLGEYDLVVRDGDAVSAA